MAMYTSYHRISQRGRKGGRLHSPWSFSTVESGQHYTLPESFVDMCRWSGDEVASALMFHRLNCYCCCCYCCFYYYYCFIFIFFIFFLNDEVSGKYIFVFYCVFVCFGVVFLLHVSHHPSRSGGSGACAVHGGRRSSGGGCDRRAHEPDQGNRRHVEAITCACFSPPLFLYMQQHSISGFVMFLWACCSLRI